MIMSKLHSYHIRENHSIMCAVKHGSIKLIACCVHASLHFFTVHYEFACMEAQNQGSVKILTVVSSLIILSESLYFNPNKYW